MIQIQESDTLWYFYKRFYKGTRVEAPSNLCKYFWVATLGALKAFFHDLHIVWATGILWLITGLLFLWQNYLGVFTEDFNKNTQNFWGTLYVVGFGLFFIISLSTFTILSITEPLFRWFTYWSEKDDRVACLSWFLLCFTIFAITLSVVFSGDEWHWTYLFIAAGFEIVVISVIVLSLYLYYTLFTDQTNLGKNILQYLSAIKNGVCPLVDPPQSFKDEQREIDLNCGDG